MAFPVFWNCVPFEFSKNIYLSTDDTQIQASTPYQSGTLSNSNEFNNVSENVKNN